MTKKAINSGVDAITGFELQRNMALFLILENYSEKFKDADYFVCLEHHEDFLYCFLNENKEILKIEAYQSKKKSPSTWKISGLGEIIEKLLGTGLELIADKMPKAKLYTHDLFFASNQTITLEGDKENTQSIKEDHRLVQYKNLHQTIQEKLKRKIKSSKLYTQLPNVNFLWVDFNRTADGQKDCLIGKFGRTFGEQVHSHRAAVDTLITLFREIEARYNDGNVVQLLDKSKQVSSIKINNALELITQKSKCFNYWREQKREISRVLKIKASLKDSFESAFENAFELFKDSEQMEHQDILNFTKIHYEICEAFTEEESVANIIELYNKSKNSNLDKIELKATFFAAYFEAINKKKTKTS